MLRYLRWRPNLFSLGRRASPSRGARGPEPQVIQMQRVKIRRRLPRPTSLLAAGMVYYICYEVYTTSVIGILSKFLDENEAAMSVKERKELDDELGDPFFIPLPLTTRTIDPLPYKGSDPEWKMFAKVSRDRKLLEDLKGSLAELTRRVLMNHPQIAMECGQDMSVQRRWLDVVYPYKPFPTFERRGYVIFSSTTTILLVSTDLLSD